MPYANRRDFLRVSGLSVMPFVLPSLPVWAANNGKACPPPAGPIIKFFGDGEMYEPADYLSVLQKANMAQAIVRDRYGSGGSVAALEKKMEEITGKQKAIYMPSGTMANQLAISVLSGQNSKVFVQETSHVFRDEADAAQTVFNKRLVPLAKDKTGFTADELKETIERLKREEAFTVELGAVSVENPVRRTDGRMIPIEELRKISEYCRSQRIPLHLDGARIYMASAWSGVSIREYAALFDTIYISLYKYLGASAGAILCGDKQVIDKMPHLVKIHGGNMYSSWPNAAMALYQLETFEGRLKEAKNRGEKLFSRLNQSRGISIQPLADGTNIYKMNIDKGWSPKKFQDVLFNDFGIRLFFPKDQHETLVSVNDTLLYRDAQYIENALLEAARKAG